MKKRVIYRILGVGLFIIGLFLMIDIGTNITGSVIGIKNKISIIRTYGSLFLIFIVLFLFISNKKYGESLEEIVTSLKWKRFDINRDSIIMDIEQGYLETRKLDERSTAQSWVERKVTGGKLIEPQTINKKRSYRDQFYEGHAAQGGRVIDVKNHIQQKGRHKGKLIHLGEPANARYLWVVDVNGNFIVANRQTMQHPMPQMNPVKIDEAHRLHKLPHPTLARGKQVFGSGEVLIEGGKVKEFSAASGHYVSFKDVEGFNKQCEAVFRYFVKKVNWKEVESGARYIQKK